MPDDTHTTVGMRFRHLLDAVERSSLQRLLRVFEPWGILLALIGFGITVHQLTVERTVLREEREARRLERINQAWALVAA